MTVRLKVPTPEMLKAVERALAASEKADAKRLAEWERNCSRWLGKAATALRRASEVPQLDPEKGSRYRGSTSYSVEVGMPHPGEKPDTDYTRSVQQDLTFLKSTDQTHITIDVDDPRDRFGRHLR